MSISSVLMTATMSLLLPITTSLIYAHPVQQDDVQRLKNSVASALPSEWRIVGVSRDESVWRHAETLREKYKGYKIELAGPTVTTQSIPKGATTPQEVTFSATAILYLIPVWPGINQAEIAKDFDTARAALPPRHPGEQRPPPKITTRLYGWNDQYLLLCDDDCPVLERVAKKLKIRKR